MVRFLRCFLLFATALAWVSGGSEQVHGSTVVLMPVADTTLIELSPENNLGSAPFVNAGTTGLNTRNRGLFRFDPGSSIPAGSKILSATLIIEVTFEPRSGGQASAFALHRLLKDWGEGDKPSDAGAPGLGFTATANEATWRDRFAFADQPWSVPGGSAGVDFVLSPSAEEFVYGVDDSPYEFGPSAALRDDVQFWLDQPNENFGWILISRSEEVRFTARRFGSREDPLNAPQLVVQFVSPPVLSITPESSGEVRLQFRAAPGVEYLVESTPGLLPANWSTVTNVFFPQSTEVELKEATTGSQRFYRVTIPDPARR
jgi:hypothetical protein